MPNDSLAVTEPAPKRAAAPTKICFLIQAPDTFDPVIRERSEYVVKTYIEPACRRALYDLKSSTQLGFQRMNQGIVNALYCAPMTVAYLGGQPWNNDVILEVGYRIASGLPLVLVCDAPGRDQAIKLPAIISDLNHVEIPPASGDDTAIKVNEVFELIPNQASEKKDPSGNSKKDSKASSDFGIM